MESKVLISIPEVAYFISPSYMEASIGTDTAEGVAPSITNIFTLSVVNAGIRDRTKYSTSGKMISFSRDVRNTFFSCSRLRRPV